jgi:DNA polymerase III epsilon subunit family exonuclease
MMQTSLFATLFDNETPSQTAAQSLLATPLHEATFTVIDLETTGLNPKRSSITEITAITFINGQETNKYSTLVKPKELIPLEVENLTGISNEMVANAPPLMMVMNELLSFVGPNPIIVGHNVSFDISFLREKCLDCGLTGLENRFAYEQAFCTKVLAQKVLPGLPSYEGIVVATQCGYHNNNPHRAEADVRMSAAILFTLIDKLKAQPNILNQQTIQALLNYQGTLASRY